MTIVLPARAKLNLDLAVLRRRDDGFHDVRTTLQAIDLHDLVSLTPADKTSLTISGLAVENTKDNSVLKALAALEEAARKKLPTEIHLHKQIPAGAGMGGASSDAATALRGLAALHHVTADLKTIAAQIGADVPFFLTGGAAIGEQRGDHLTPVPTQQLWFAIAWPGFELLTKDVYRAWDKIDQSSIQSWNDSPNHLTHAAMSIEPRLQEFANALNRLGPTWQMTGSGSAYFCHCADEALARNITSELKVWTAVAQAIGPWAE
ncbi:MAG TPA: 4-(cytidine 5'-diphospho)-2-C-methyl-D-erythritol kinase [Candidatus Nitrosotalea sp.]|nr:4-(cytidine 5'-diphospho)-2-C-methyl-D-erythritol kinase [Candidatus Nitrosotalea sp.]